MKIKHLNTIPINSGKLLRYKVRKGTTLTLTAEMSQHTFGYPRTPEPTKTPSTDKSNSCGPNDVPR